MNTEHRTPHTEYRAQAPRLCWYLAARFGLSLHFGLYSIPGRGEWIRSSEQLTDADYQHYFDAFNPDPDCARAWAQAARAAGARYVVLTAKHHDGFCLFDSQLTDFKSTTTPARRDLIREYVDALRAEGLRVGFYYSLIDWHHPDYPAAGDRQHPLRHTPAARQCNAHCVWSRYLEYLHGHVRELCTNYGPLDLLVFDFSYWEFHGEHWGATDLVRMIRTLQPDVVINDRLGRESIKEVAPPAYAGDYDQAELDIPREPVCDQAGRPIPWESWLPLSNSWAHNPADTNYKSAATIIRALVNCVSKGGNLLLNVAPDPRGHLDAPTQATLAEIGAWLARNGESVYGCGPAPLPKPEWGRFTQHDNRLYAHVLEPVIGHMALPGLRGRVNNPHILATGQDAVLCNYWNPGIQTFDAPDDIFFNFRAPPQSTWPLPDARDAVVRFALTTPVERARLLDEYRTAFAHATARRPL